MAESQPNHLEFKKGAEEDSMLQAINISCDSTMKKETC